MTIPQTEYLAEHGITTFSYQGYQKFNSVSKGRFYYGSPLHTDITVSDKWTTDSCWETGDLFYVSGNTVYKTKYDGTRIAHIELTNPVSISVIQPTFDVLSTKYGSDLGCWIVDETEKVVIQTDPNMNVVRSVTNLSNPVRVITASDRGCYIFDDSLKWIMKFNESLEMESFLNYSSVNIITADDAISLEATSDSGLCVLVNNKVYVIKYSNGGISISTTISPLNYVLLDGAVSDISIQKTSSMMYAVGCSTTGSWIAKFQISPTVSMKKSALFTYGFARRVEASQYTNAEDIYVIIEEDPALLPPECVSSSSSSSSSSLSSSSSSSSSNSSSSSSSGGGSSSSSSSIDSSSSSSSESSSSSLGYSMSSTSSSSIDSSSSSSSLGNSSSSSSSFPVQPDFIGSGFACPEANGNYYDAGKFYNDHSTEVYFQGVILPPAPALPRFYSGTATVLMKDNFIGRTGWKIWIDATYSIRFNDFGYYVISINPNVANTWLISDYIQLYPSASIPGIYFGECVFWSGVEHCSNNACANGDYGTIVEG